MLFYVYIAYSHLAFCFSLALLNESCLKITVCNNFLTSCVGCFVDAQENVFSQQKLQLLYEKESYQHLGTLLLQLFMKSFDLGL